MYQINTHLEHLTFHFTKNDSPSSLVDHRTQSIKDPAQRLNMNKYVYEMNETCEAWCDSYRVFKHNFDALVMNGCYIKIMSVQVSDFLTLTIQTPLCDNTSNAAKSTLKIDNDIDTCVQMHLFSIIFIFAI